MRRTTVAIALMFAAGSLSTSCTREPEVGSPEWCKAEADSGHTNDYTMKEIGTFAKHCMFDKQPAE